MLRGENFLLDFVDKERKHGFFTTVWVDAKDPEEAELKAVDKIRKQEDLSSGLLNRSDDFPMIYLEEIQEIDSQLQENGGRAFFPELDEEARIEAKQLAIDAEWS